MLKFEHLSGHAVPAGVVAAGGLLSVLASVFPHFDSAYRLMALPMFSGLAAYTFYGVLAGLWNSEPVRRAGLRMLGAHLLGATALRLFAGESWAVGGLSLMPALLAAYLIRLWPEALRASDPLRRHPDR